MISISYILIATLVCLLVLAVQTYFNFQEHKQKRIIILLIFFCCPLILQAQYVDNRNYRIDFRQYENYEGKLEYTKNNITYKFVPKNDAWKVIIRNTSTEDIQINWKNAEFIISGKASGVSLYPFNTDNATMEKVESNSETTQIITASNLISDETIKKIYSKRDFNKNRKITATIVLPIAIGDNPRFFYTFDFIISKEN